MVIRRPSPNFGPRRGVAEPDAVILHFTAMTDCSAALDRLCAPKAQVSAHWLIADDGRVFGLVDENMRAWHAGRSFWAGETDLNSRSIGIELDYPGKLAGFPPFAAAQMAALDELLAGILARWAIPSQRVLGHSDIAPGRKFDPGPKFDWQRLAAAGLARARPDFAPAPPQWPGFLAALAAIGYGAHLERRDLLDAFRLRWRQGHVGPLDAVDMGLANALAIDPGAGIT